MAREGRLTGEGGDELSKHGPLLKELIDMEDEIERHTERKMK